MTITVLAPVRCPRCNKKLALRLEGTARFFCPRCKTVVDV